MATTTNYSWTTPDDTALVKDGAAAIRTLGSSIDTTTKNLNPSTTLGDIEYRSSTANTNTRLAIGTSGQVLTVASGVPSWATPSSGGMTLLSTNSLSGATTHTISSISGDYKHLFFLGKMFKTAGNNEAISIRFNSDSGSNYYGVIWRSINTTLSAEVMDGTTSLLNIISTQDNDTVSQRAQFAINLYRYTDTDNVSGIFDTRGSSNTGRVQTHGYFTYDNSAAVDSISLVSSGPNITGTLYVYGVK